MNCNFFNTQHYVVIWENSKNTNQFCIIYYVFCPQGEKSGSKFVSIFQKFEFPFHQSLCVKVAKCCISSFLAKNESLHPILWVIKILFSSFILRVQVCSLLNIFRSFQWDLHTCQKWVKLAQHPVYNTLRTLQFSRWSLLWKIILLFNFFYREFWDEIASSFSNEDNFWNIDSLNYFSGIGRERYSRKN